MKEDYENYDILYSIGNSPSYSSNKSNMNDIRGQEEPLIMTSAELRIILKINDSISNEVYSRQGNSSGSKQNKWYNNEAYGRWLKSFTLVIGSAPDTYSQLLLVPDLEFCDKHLQRRINKSIHHVTQLIGKNKKLKIKSHKQDEMSVNNTNETIRNLNVYCSLAPSRYFLSNDRSLKYRNATFSSVFEEDINQEFLQTHTVSNIHTLNTFFGWFFPLTTKRKYFNSKINPENNYRSRVNFEELEEQSAHYEELFPIVSILTALGHNNPFIKFILEELDRGKVASINIGVLFYIELFKLRYLSTSEAKTVSNSHLSFYTDHLNSDVFARAAPIIPTVLKTDAEGMVYSECESRINIPSCEFNDWLKTISRTEFSSNNPLFLNEFLDTCVTFSFDNVSKELFNKVNSCHLVDGMSKKYLTKTSFSEEYKEERAFSFDSDEESESNKLCIPDDSNTRFYLFYRKSSQLPVRINKRKRRGHLKSFHENVNDFQYINTKSPYYAITMPMLHKYIRLYKKQKQGHFKSINAFNLNNKASFNVSESSYEESECEMLIKSQPDRTHKDTSESTIPFAITIHNSYSLKSPENSSEGDLVNIESNNCLETQNITPIHFNPLEKENVRIRPFFQNSDNLLDPSGKFSDEEKCFSSQEVERNKLFVGYTLPKFEIPKFDTSSPCLKHMPDPFVTVSENSSVSINISEFYLDDIYNKESRSVQTLLTPFLLKICRLSSTNPLNLMILNLSNDVRTIDSSILSYFSLKFPDMFNNASDEDIINVKRMFNALIDVNKEFKVNVDSQGCLKYIFSNTNDELPLTYKASKDKLANDYETFELNNGFMTSYLKNSMGKVLHADERVNYSYLVSQSVKDILFYSSIFSLPTSHNNLICYTEPVLKSHVDNNRPTVFCAWYFSDSVSPRDLNETSYKNIKFINLNETDKNKYKDIELQLNFDGSSYLNDGNVCMLNDVPFLSAPMIEKDLSTWEKLYHDTEGIKNPEDVAYLSNLSEDDQSSCGHIDYRVLEEECSNRNGYYSENSNQSSTDENNSLVLSDEDIYNDFELFLIPEMFDIPKVEPNPLFVAASRDDASINIKCFENAQKRSQGLFCDIANSCQDVYSFESRMNNDCNFEDDKDFEVVTTDMKGKIEGRHPLSQALFNLSLKEYEEQDQYLNKHFLFTTYIFNYPRDCYTFGRYSENPIVGPESKPFKQIYDSKPLSTKALVGKNIISSTDETSDHRKYLISIKDIKLFLEPLSRRILDHYYLCSIKNKKLRAKEIETLAVISRKEEKGRLKKDHVGSARSSSDILHIIPKSIVTTKSVEQAFSPGSNQQLKSKGSVSDMKYDHSKKSSLGMVSDIISESSVLTFETKNDSYNRIDIPKHDYYSKGFSPSSETKPHLINIGSTNKTWNSLLNNNMMGGNVNMNSKAFPSHNFEDDQTFLANDEVKNNTINSAHFNVRLCKFPVSAAFKKSFDRYLTWLTLDKIDHLNAMNNEIGQISRIIINRQPQFYFSFIQKLHEFYNVSEEDLMPPEYDLRPYTKDSVIEHKHWLPLRAFFNPHFSDPRADTRTDGVMMEGFIDNDGLKYFPTGLAWLPLVPSANLGTNRDMNIKKVQCTWQRVLVYDYFSDEDAYVVLPVSLEFSPMLVNRVYLVFLFENSDLAAERIHKSIVERNIAEEQLRSFLFFSFSESHIALVNSLLREVIPPDCEIEMNVPRKDINHTVYYPEYNQPRPSFKTIRSIAHGNETVFTRPCRNLRKENKRLVDICENLTSMKTNRKPHHELIQKSSHQNMTKERNLIKAGLYAEKRKGLRLAWRIKKSPKTKKISLIPKRHYSLKQMNFNKSRWKFQPFLESMADPKIKIIHNEDVKSTCTNTIRRANVNLHLERNKYGSKIVHNVFNQSSRLKQRPNKNYFLPANVFDSGNTLHKTVRTSCSTFFCKGEQYDGCSLPGNSLNQFGGKSLSPETMKDYKCQNQIFDTFNRVGSMMKRSDLVDKYLNLLFDDNCSASVVLKINGDMKKCAYASQSAYFYTLCQVEREVANINGMAFLNYLIMKYERLRRRFSKYSSTWDLELLSLKRPSVKISYVTNSDRTFKYLPSEADNFYELAGISIPMASILLNSASSERKLKSEKIKMDTKEINSLVFSSKTYLDAVIDVQNIDNDDSPKAIIVKKPPLYEWIPFKFNRTQIKTKDVSQTNIIEPQRHKVLLSRLRYNLMKSAFRESYLYTRPQMYTLLERHHNACYHIKNMRVLYTPKIMKCKTLKSFIEISTHHTNNDLDYFNISQFHSFKFTDPDLFYYGEDNNDMVIRELYFLRNTMFNNMEAFLDKHNISTFMKHFRKNEFTQRLKSVRLVKFFTYLLSEAIRTSLEESVKQFEFLIESIMGKLNQVKDDYVWGANLHSNRFEGSIYHPFFKLKLSIQNEPHVFENLDLFEEKIMDTIWAPIELMVQIGPLNPFPTGLDLWPANYTIKSYGLEEKVIVRAIKTIKTLLQKNIAALKAYMKEYEPDSQILKIEPEEYAMNFVNNNNEIEAVLEEVKHHQKESKMALRKFPRRIVIGMFEISTRWMGVKLMRHRNSICKFLTIYYGASYAQKTTFFTKRFSDIYTDFLPKKPMDFEQLFESERIVNEAYRNFQKIVPEILQHFTKFEKLAELRLNLSEGEVIELGELIYRISVINQMYVETGCFELPKMKHVLIECLKYYEEQFVMEIDEVAHKVLPIKKLTDIKEYQEICAALKILQESIDKLIEKAELFKYRREMLGIRPRDFVEISQITKDVEPYKLLWFNVLEWRTCKKAWYENEIGKTDINLQEAKFNDCYRLISRSIRDFRSYPELQEIAISIRDEMDQFRFFMELFHYLHAPFFSWHFEIIKSKTGIDLKDLEHKSFSDLLDLGVLRIVEVLKEWSENATREYTIYCGLQKISNEWRDAELTLLPHRKLKYYTMKITDEHLQMLEDHKSQLLQLLYSPFRGNFEEELLKWENNLRICNEAVFCLLECQKLWLYLEPIFSSPDIAEQLPKESSLFMCGDSFWKYFMKLAKRKGNVRKIHLYNSKTLALDALIKIMVFAGDKKLLRQANSCYGLFHDAMLGLNKYMEGKRQAFPRFYFLSDEELIDMLSQGKNPLAVQPHLRKCFENIYKLTFKKDLRIVAMSSLEGEFVKMAPSMYPEGILEEWLNKLEAIMKRTVRVNIYHALIALAHTERAKWILQWPGQIVIAGSQTIWTARIERGIERNKMNVYFQRYLEMLNELRSVIRGELTKVQRQVVSSLIVIEVHARDVFENLVQLNISSVKDFYWISQLRYYWIKQNLKVKAMNAVFKYGYEYLGNSGRLVITPLTDRCYLTLTGALHLKFGGAPAGPAGTGKTESTKDLAKAFAIQCVVFNCSDQLDYKAMGKFFKGLAGSGAWACFDEFNRIDIEVLSVVAQQITTIQQAQFARAKSCLFEGAWIKLKSSCAVFITMNPGYAGRTELPDNLKALFRPVAMMVPDYTLIAEISLFSFGFSDSKQLAGKITTTFKLSSEQLSTQDHYDFGMRAVKTVIAVAGNLKREHPKMDERQIILRALNDVNVPKFLNDDLKLFRGIVSDLFPLMEAQAIDYGSFKRNIKWIIFREFKLQPVNSYVTKVIQLYETTVVRHGLMLVGPAGSGKTKCYEILQRTMTFYKGQTNPNGGKFSRVNTYVLNPKAITMGQLYGEVDINTLEWTDGILPFYARKGAISNNDHKRWYVFDGPVDAVWIENMNTVLDDNKKLCLTSGEVIKMSDHMTMMFEVADLAVASPATVSRCGMVYLEPGVLGLEPYIDAWLRRLPKMVKPYAERFRILLNRYTINGLKFMRRHCVEFVPSMDTNILQSCFRLLNIFLKPVKIRDTGRKPTNEVSFQIKICMSGWVVFSTLWSVGATCDDRSRDKFSEFMKYKITKHNAFPRSPKRSLYDYNFSDGGFSDVQNRTFGLPRWVSWTSKVSEYIVKSDVNYSDIEVPTIDNIRSANLVGRLLEAYNDVLCIGPTGTGKSITIMSKLTRNMPNNFVVDFMTFSARTSSRQTQEVIEAKLDKIKKFVRGAPSGKVQILFIDDFNMPAPETYGAQPPLELIRQFLDFGGWYSLLEVGQFLKIVDVTIVAAMGPPGGGRNSVSARLLRHFHYISFPEISYISKKMIFGTILLSWIEKMKFHEKYGFGLKVLELTLDTYSTIERELLPTPAKMHYTFNLRDLSKIFQGILMAKAENYYKSDFLILWYHEHCRVYGDRLVNDQDSKWFDDLLANKVNQHLEMEPNWPRGIMKKGSTSLEFCYLKEHLVFADLLTAFDDKIYERVPNIILLSKVLELYLYAYNISAKIQMDLVLFEEAVSHVCRIARIIRQPLGNALLLGLAGSGRQSVTRLAATTTEYTCFQVELTKAYNMNDWRDDLKKMMMGAGLYKKDTVFLFSDTQVKFEGFLEDINNILNSGDVPNIYQAEDKDLIMGAVRTDAIDQGIAPTYPNLFTFYLKQIKARLHTVVTMSPIGEVFRARLRQFPALVNCCTIDWFSEWPELALRRVGNHYISRAARSLKMPTYLTTPVVQTCLLIHTTVLRNRDLYLKECARQVYITPSHFLEFLRTFIVLCEDKVGKNYAEIIRLTEGIQKLANTEDEIADMQDTILRAEPELIRQGKTAANMLEYIEKSKAAAQVKSKKVLKSTLEIANIRRKVAEITYEARIKLAKAMPELLAAKEELQTLNKNDLSEIKALAKPPPGVRLTMEAVCVLLGVTPVMVASEIGFGKKVMDYWIPATKLLADPGKFLQVLFGFKIENVEYSTILKLRKYIEDPEFEPQKIKKASKACMSLCKWVFAMVKYYYVNKDIEPKIKALKESKQLMRKMNAQLRHANKLLAKTKNRIEQLEETLRQTQKKQKEIQDSVKWSKNRQIKAKHLVKSLGNEKHRWSEKQMKLQFISRFFFGEFIIAAGLIAYLGPFTSKYRNEMIDSWYDIMNNLKAPYIYKDGEFLKAFVNSLSIENWIINGLPRDNFSVQNGVIVNYSQRWSLFIDPQKQASKWIKKTYKSLVRVVKMEDPSFKDVLCQSITNGFIMVAETSTCELDSSLDPVLYKQIILSGDGKMIQIGELILPYEDRFRFYITTTLPNPSLSPDVFIKLAVINFTISASGLQEQLIGLTVQNEIPGLERYKVRLIESTAKLKEEIRYLQDLILQLITQTKNPIDDRRLKATLQESKVTTEIATEKISAANKAKRVLDDVRVKYNIIAIKGQLLYFCVSELSIVDPMYQYSLDWFIDIFNKTLVSKNKAQEDTILELESMKRASLTQDESSQPQGSMIESHEEEDPYAMATKNISFINYDPALFDFKVISSDDDDENDSITEVVKYEKIVEKITKSNIKNVFDEKRKKAKILRKNLMHKSSTRDSSRLKEQRITRNTILLWRMKGKKGGSRFSLKKGIAGEKHSKTTKSSFNVEKKSDLGKAISPEMQALREERLKKERIEAIESTIHLLRNKPNEPRQRRYCFKVSQILKNRRKAMLELQVELKIIKLRRKLLIVRKQKQMKIEEQFQRKIKRLHHIRPTASMGNKIEENLKKRQALLRLLNTPEGRDKLRKHLNATLKERAKGSEDLKLADTNSVQVRCKSVTTDLINNVYSNVCRSLFEKHKVIFAFLLSIRLMRANRRLDPEEWKFFLTGGSPNEFQDLPLPEDAPWMSERMWKDMLSLGNIPSFRKFVKSFIKNYNKYQRIVESKNPQIEPLPYPWAEDFTLVQRLLVLKVLRYDKLIDGMYEFVKVSFGYEFIEPKVTDISDMYGDSSPTIPLIFVLSPGTDPANDLYKFAQKLSMTKHFYSISLGQGQGAIAEQMFKKAVINGHWVFFQNCHLAPSWMPKLELLIENIDPDFTNKNFRIWLTSLPSPYFPVGILQKSSKITMEPPRGVKANLLRAYTGQVNEFKEIINNTESPKAELFRCLLFSICLFHGMILERRKYGSLGFNNKYEFTDGDLRICISQLKMFLDEYSDIPFQVLKYTAGQINYGGRITDDWDRRAVTHLLEDYYCDQVLTPKYAFDTKKWYEQQPPCTNLEQYVKSIQSIPSIDYPELFGLHENASINYAFKETNLLFDVLFDLHPQVSGGESESVKERILKEKVSLLCTSIPPFYDEMAIKNIKSRFPVMYTESLNTVVVQEILRYNNLLKVIHQTLIDLTKAIAGTVVMSDNLEKMSRSLLINRVPELWSAKAYPSLKLLADWVLDLINRLKFLESWQLEGKLEKYWISGLYFPQAFLTACLQNHARRHVLPIDSLSFQFIVMPRRKYEDSTTIHGLFMEGARWDAEACAIGESIPKILYTEMPDIVLIPEQYHVKPHGAYTCPVYKTLLRAGTLSTTGHSTNFILPIEIPSKHPEGHWVKRSVACFTAVED